MEKLENLEEIEEKNEEFNSKNACKSLCWRCNKCTSLYECKWVRFCTIFTCTKRFSHEELIKFLPKGVTLDEEDNVKTCPDFESDGLIWTIEDKAKSLGISVKEYKKQISRKRNRLRYLKENKIKGD